MEAADDRGVAEVAFYVDGRRRSVDPEAPCAAGVPARLQLTLVVANGG